MTEQERLKDYLSEMIDLKKQGVFYKDIAEIYHTSTSSVRRLLNQNGIIIRNKLSDNDIDKIIKMYDEDNITIKDISEKYHLSEKTVSNILKNNNVHIKTTSECKQIYTLDEKYFDIIDTNNKAYLLGWLWSDGHNDTTHHKVQISLQQGDKYILEIFNKELKSNRPIKFLDRSKELDYNRQNQYRLIISNKHLSESLLRLGMVHDKGLTAIFPNIPPEYYSHFIRGYFEGDGWVSKNPKNCRMNFTGTIWLCEGIQKILMDMLHINSYLTIPHNKVDKPTRTLIVAGKNQVKTALNYIYYSSDYVLQRKYNIYQEYYA